MRVESHDGWIDVPDPRPHDRLLDAQSQATRDERGSSVLGTLLSDFSGTSCEGERIDTAGGQSAVLVQDQFAAGDALDVVERATRSQQMDRLVGRAK